MPASFSQAITAKNTPTTTAAPTATTTTTNNNNPPVWVGDEHLHVRVALEYTHGVLGRHLAERAHGAELECGLDRSQEHLNSKCNTTRTRNKHTRHTHTREPKE